MQSQTYPTGLGVVRVDTKVYLYGNKPNTDEIFFIATSEDGLQFTPYREKPVIMDLKKRVQNTENCTDFRISHVNNKYILSYKLKHLSAPQLRFAESTDLVHWKRLGSVSSIRDAGLVIPEYTQNGKYVLLFGDKEIRIAYSSDLLSWDIVQTPVLSPRSNFFDSDALSVATARLTERGLAVLYYARETVGGKSRYGLGLALLDTTTPTKILWRSENPLISHVTDFGNKDVTPVGVIEKDDVLISYWNIAGEGVVAAVHPKSHTRETSPKKGLGLTLGKLVQNPILKPIAHHFWESKQVFNPAAVYEAGKVHLVYRAIGDSDMSMLGYASTTDGYTIDARSKVPAFVPTQPREHLVTPGMPYVSPFMSGGGAYGGAEDPRLTKIDDRIYMTYIAYDGGSPPRVALTSISVNDFLNHRWNWEHPVMISPPGVVDKNAAILPEKIGGKYVIFHRIYPNILIDFVDNLEFDGKRYLKGEYRIGPRRDYWDSRKVGIGPTPLKTDEGWLVIYHAVGEQEPGRYKIGAMLLDSQDPTKVIARGRKPILEPDQWYENEGFKSGVAYPCGSAIVKENLFVYYGGADQVVCAASANTKEFLHILKNDQSVNLKSVSMTL